MNRKSTYLLAIIFFLLSACSEGIVSHKPIIEKNGSDYVSNIAGYWIWESTTDIKENGKVETSVHEHPTVYFVEELTTGLPFFKDYLYKVTTIFTDKTDIDREKTDQLNPCYEPNKENMVVCYKSVFQVLEMKMVASITTHQYFITKQICTHYMIEI